MALAGPMTVIDSTLNEAYTDEAELAMDIAAAINAELLDLQAAGCDMFQLDEPAMTRYHDKVFAYGARALDRCLEGVTVPTIVHLCYGYPGGAALQHHYTYPELLDRADADARSRGFTVEFARSDYDPAILKPYRDRLIMFGCIDPGQHAGADASTRSSAASRRRSSISIRTRVLLAPDCGLMTISRALAREKLAVMVRRRRLRRDVAAISGYARTRPGRDRRSPTVRGRS